LCGLLRLSRAARRWRRFHAASSRLNANKARWDFPASLMHTLLNFVNGYTFHLSGDATLAVPYSTFEARNCFSSLPLPPDFPFIFLLFLIGNLDLLYSDDMFQISYA